MLTFLYCIFLKGLLAIRLIADAVICFLVCKKINLLSKSFSRKVSLTFLAVGVDLKNKSSGASCQLITVFWPPDILVIVAIFPEKKKTLVSYFHSEYKYVILTSSLGCDLVDAVASALVLANLKNMHVMNVQSER